MSLKARLSLALLGALFLFGGTLLGLAGFARDSSPGWENLPSVNVYASRPDMKVTLTMEVFRPLSGSAICDVFLRLDEENIGDQVLVVSSTPSAQPEGRTDRELVELSIPDGATGGQDVAYYYLWTSAGPQASNNNDARGFMMYSYELGRWPDELGQRDFDFKLPTIGLTQQKASYDPAFGSDTDFGHAQLGSSESLVRNPAREEGKDSDSNYVGHYYDLNGNVLPQLYWTPVNQQSVMRILYLGDILANSRIDISQPGTGTLEGDDYTWNGGLALAPRLTGTNLSRDRERQAALLMAGVFYGTGASALLTSATVGGPRAPIDGRGLPATTTDTGTGPDSKYGLLWVVLAAASLAIVSLLSRKRSSARV